MKWLVNRQSQHLLRSMHRVYSNRHRPDFPYQWHPIHNSCCHAPGWTSSTTFHRFPSNKLLNCMNVSGIAVGQIDNVHQTKNPTSCFAFLFRRWLIRKSIHHSIVKRWSDLQCNRKFKVERPNDMGLSQVAIIDNRSVCMAIVQSISPLADPLWCIWWIKQIKKRWISSENLPWDCVAVKCSI